MSLKLKKNKREKSKSPPYESSGISVEEALPSFVLDVERTLYKLEKRMKIYEERIDDMDRDMTFLENQHKIIKASLNPSSSRYKIKHDERFVTFDTNPPAKRQTPTVLSITALCLCHGGININIVKKIKKSSDVKLSRPSVRNKNGIIRVNYDDKFVFEYSNVDYDGLFSNAGSCTGMPVVKIPNETFNMHDIVEREKNIMMGVLQPPRMHANNFMLVCSPEFKDVPFEEIQSSGMRERSKDCLSLVLHENFTCKSLINKKYQSDRNETRTLSGAPTLYDIGKFILLTKIQYGVEDPVIIKTIILGDGCIESTRELKAILNKSFDTSFVRESGSIYETTTEDIINLINEIKEEDTAVKIVDLSCNTIDAIDPDSITNPGVFTMFEKLTEYFTNMTSRQSSIHGGFSKRTRKLNYIH